MLRLYAILKKPAQVETTQLSFRAKRRISVSAIPEIIYRGSSPVFVLLGIISEGVPSGAKGTPLGLHPTVIPKRVFLHTGP